MNIKTLAIGIATSLVLAAPAMAFDRSGTSHFRTRFGDAIGTFQQSYNPDDGTFSRSGRVKMGGGRTLTYALAGACETPGTAYDFTGDATGPFGGKWHAEGTLKRESDGVHLIGELTTPDGRTMDFDRLARGRRRFQQAPAQ